MIPEGSPIALLAVPSMRYDVKHRATGETFLRGVDLDTALAEIDRLDTEAGERVHIAQEILISENGNIG